MTSKIIRSILTVLGILLFAGSIGLYFYADAQIQEDMSLSGVDVLAARSNIPKDTVVQTVAQARELFTVKRLRKDDVVAGSLEARIIKRKIRDGVKGVIDRIQNIFKEDKIEISNDTLEQLVGLRITTKVYKNQQILKGYISADVDVINPNERLIAVQLPDSVAGLGGDMAKGAYVDAWVIYDRRLPSGEKQVEKIFSALQIVKVKDSKSNEVIGGKGTPSIIYFSLEDDGIKFLKSKESAGTLFFTQWGVTPNIDQIMHSEDGGNQIIHTEEGDE